jgi:hypothetical protein
MLQEELAVSNQSSAFPHRAGEKPAKRRRSPDRCFQINGSWYFATREGLNVGPYTTKEIADAAAARLSAVLTGVRDGRLARRLIEASIHFTDRWQRAG